MRRQTGDHDCGPTAIANAFEFHHRRTGLGGLRALCGTTVAGGTDEDGIIRGLLAYGCGVDVLAELDPRAALTWLRASLITWDRPVLLCVDRWEHWVTVVGASARQFLIYDPSREAGGAFALRDKDLRRRWEAAKRVRGRTERFYGISVGPPDARVGGRVVR